MKIPFTPAQQKYRDRLRDDFKGFTFGKPEDNLDIDPEIILGDLVSNSSIQMIRQDEVEEVISMLQIVWEKNGNTGEINKRDNNS